MKTLLLILSLASGIAASASQNLLTDNWYSIQTNADAWYKLDGNGNDSSIHGYNMSAVGVPYATNGPSGIAGKAMYFQSILTQYYTVTNSAIVTNRPITITGWFRVPSANQSIIGSADNGLTTTRILTQTFAGSFAAYGQQDGGTAILTGSPIIVDQWMFLVVVFDTTKYTAYQFYYGNFRAASVGAVINITPFTMEHIAFGAGSASATAAICGVRFYNQAINQQEATLLYSIGLSCRVY